MADAEGHKDIEAFNELQQKMMIQTQTLKNINSLHGAAREKIRRMTLTAQEVDKCPDDTNVYQSVGKAYLLTTKASIVNELVSHAKAEDEEAKRLTAQRERLEREAKETEAEIRELLKGSKVLQERMAARVRAQ